MEKTDIRARFTKKVLQDSIIEIMKTKPILKITIKEICDKADISRSTFYTYYKDQYDLLRQMEDETLVEIEKIVQPYLGAVKKSNVTGAIQQDLLLDILQYIATNTHFIQVLMGENGNPAFQKKVFSYGIERSRQFKKGNGKNPLDEKTSRYFSLFVTGGMLTLVQEWLKTGMDTPVPQMVKMIAAFTREAALA
jgi:AcrR family transcriptional regulator